MKTCKKKNHTYPKEKKQCPECIRARYQKNAEKLKAEMKLWYEANKNKRKTSMKAWREANPEKFKASRKAWHEANKDKYDAYNSAYHKVWYQKNSENLKANNKAYYKANPEKAKTRNAKRRAAKLQRSLNYQKRRFFFEGYYKLAKLVSNTLNEPIHVDHIIPLQGKDVSGLHVPANVQLLDERDNLAKNNSFDFTYENKSWKSK